MADCVVCLFKNKFDIFRLVFPIKSSCTHSMFSIIKRQLYLNLYFCILGFVNVSYYFSFLSEICNNTSFVCIVFLTDQFKIVETVMLMALYFRYLEDVCLELNTCVMLYQKLTKISLKNRIAVANYRSIQMTSYITLSIIYMEFIILTFVVHWFTSDFVPWFYFRRLTTIVCCVTQSYGVFLVNTRITLMGIVLKTFKKSVYLDKRNKTLTLFRVKEYCKIISILHSIIKKMSTYGLFAFTIWTLLSVYSLIFNIYVAIRLLDYDVYVVRVLQLRVSFTIFELLLMCIYTETNLKKKVSLVFLEAI